MLVAVQVLIQASYYFPDPGLPFNSDAILAGFSLFVIGVIGMSVVLKKYDPRPDRIRYNYSFTAGLDHISSEDISDSTASNNLGSTVVNILFFIFGPVIALFGDLLLPKGTMFVFPGIVMMMAGIILMIFGMLAIVSKYILGTL